MLFRLSVLSVIGVVVFPSVALAATPVPICVIGRSPASGLEAQAVSGAITLEARKAGIHVSAVYVRTTEGCPVQTPDRPCSSCSSTASLTS